MARILKFGGSSLADAACLREVAALVGAALPHAPVVVLSAMGDATDWLFRAAHAARDGDLARALECSGRVRQHCVTTAAELLEQDARSRLAAVLEPVFGELEERLRGVALLAELSARSTDAIAAVGERCSCELLTAYLAQCGVECEWLDARRIVRTDEHYGAARPLADELREAVARELAPRALPGRAVVTQGYVGGHGPDGTTTLGRGGSDLSAALIGAALGAAEVQIWTDVEGVQTVDPRLVPGARSIPELSFAEAAELAAFGARVLHPAMIQPALEARVPVTVRHTRRPGGQFTSIRPQVAQGRPVTALATRGPVTILTVSTSRMLAQSGFLARLFEVFGRLRVSVDLVATAEVSVSLTVEHDAPLAELCAEISGFAALSVSEGRSIVALVGEQLRQTPGIAARAFGALQGIEIEMISMGANEINLSLVVAGERTLEVIERLHREFFSDGA